MQVPRPSGDARRQRPSSSCAAGRPARSGPGQPRVAALTANVRSIYFVVLSEHLTVLGRRSKAGQTPTASPRYHHRTSNAVCASGTPKLAGGDPQPSRATSVIRSARRCSNTCPEVEPGDREAHPARLPACRRLPGRPAHRVALHDHHAPGANEDTPRLTISSSTFSSAISPADRYRHITRSLESRNALSASARRRSLIS